MVNPYAAYIKTDLETMPLPKIIASGYERIILELKSAIEDIKTGDLKSKINHIHKALEILRVLRLGLDFEKGGEIAVNLDNIYEFLERHISLGNLKNDEKILNEAIEILNIVKSGWDEIA
ncbi:MAG: flagellar export chaperone FliS [Hydrogenothermaceae bacterium]|nr:flagellar export chaperone FliS [Hydrogenothermaceae bacterium]